MATMEEIEVQAERLAQARTALELASKSLTQGVDALKAKHMPEIRALTAQCAEQELMLKALVKESPGLFARPKSKLLHAIRCGWKQQPLALEIADAENTVRLIKLLMPDQVNLLVKTEETPRKDALKALDAKTLKAIGVALTPECDVPFVSAQSADPVAKVVSSLIAAELKDSE